MRRERSAVGGGVTYCVQQGADPIADWAGLGLLAQHQVESKHAPPPSRWRRLNRPGGLPGPPDEHVPESGGCGIATEDSRNQGCHQHDRQDQTNDKPQAFMRRPEEEFTFRSSLLDSSHRLALTVRAHGPNRFMPGEYPTKSTMMIYLLHG